MNQANHAFEYPSSEPAPAPAFRQAAAAPPPPPRVPPGRYEVRLQSGHTAWILDKALRKMKAHKAAHKAAGRNPDQATLACHYFAQIVLIDGQRVTGEDLIEWTEESFAELAEAVDLGKAPTTDPSVPST